MQGPSTDRYDDQGTAISYHSCPKKERGNIMTFASIAKLDGEAYRTAYAQCYAYMKSHMQDVPVSVHKQLVQACQRNRWLKVHGIVFEEDPDMESDYPFNFQSVDDLRALREYFSHGNWAIRDGVVFGDLAFINQVNGGDEWWTLKWDGENWVGFESCSMDRIIRSGKFQFESLISHMQRATVAQCKNLDYMQA